MKTFGKMSFGMSVVTVAKRGVTSEPELVLNTTVGNMRMTAPVTRALGIADGDYVMFISNVAAIDFAISQKSEELMQWCKENGLDINEVETINKIHEEFDCWGIAKGIQEFDAKGNPMKINERWTKPAKIKFVTEKFDELYQAAVESGNEEFIAALNAEGMTKENQIELIADSLQGDLVNKYRGAKCANAADLKGIGQILSFADAGVWVALKSNMGDKAKTHNRVFEVNVKDLETVTVNNGYQDIEVKVALLGNYKDVESSRSKKDETDETSETDETAVTE